MKIVNPIILALIFALFSCTDIDNHKAKDTSITADEVTPEDQKIVKLIREKDSLLFQIGFNQIDTLQVAKLTSTDFEFYHDEHGITETKSEFVTSINGIRELPFKTWRTLLEGSMEVFPLYKDNSQVLYGATKIGFMSSINSMKAKLLKKQIPPDSLIYGLLKMGIGN